jgi:hypothetical protein
MWFGNILLETTFLSSFLLFFSGTGFELMLAVSHASSPSCSTYFPDTVLACVCLDYHPPTCASHGTDHCCLACLWEGSSLAFCQGWPWPMILLPSPSMQLKLQACTTKPSPSSLLVFLNLFSFLDFLSFLWFPHDFYCSRLFVKSQCEYFILFD